MASLEHHAAPSSSGRVLVPAEFASPNSGGVSTTRLAGLQSTPSFDTSAVRIPVRQGSFKLAESIPMNTDPPVQKLTDGVQKSNYKGAEIQPLVSDNQVRNASKENISQKLQRHVEGVKQGLSRANEGSPQSEGNTWAKEIKSWASPAPESKAVGLGERLANKIGRMRAAYFEGAGLTDPKSDAALARGFRPMSYDSLDIPKFALNRSAIDRPGEPRKEADNPLKARAKLQALPPREEVLEEPKAAAATNTGIGHPFASSPTGIGIDTEADQFNRHNGYLQGTTQFDPDKLEKHVFNGDVLAKKNNQSIDVSDIDTSRVRPLKSMNLGNATIPVNNTPIASPGTSEPISLPKSVAPAQSPTPAVSPEQKVVNPTPASDGEVKFYDPPDFVSQRKRQPKRPAYLT
jgi:hypothetical protein